MSLFIEGIDSPDPTYKLVRDSLVPSVIQGKKFAEELWREYEPYADSNFKTALQVDFDSRYWEMYLTVSLIRAGCNIVKRKPNTGGPDILLDYDGKRIWIEAIAPTGGNPLLLDSVPTFKPNPLPTVGDIPENEIVLRMRSAIEEKQRKWASYKSKGIVSDRDRYIVAINMCKIMMAMLDRDIPRVVRCVYGLGDPVITFNRDTGEQISYEIQFKPEIQKTSGAPISTSIFNDPQYANISALISSRVHVESGVELIKDKDMLKDYICVHNRLAQTPIELIQAIENYKVFTNPNGLTVQRYKKTG